MHCVALQKGSLLLRSYGMRPASLVGGQHVSIEVQVIICACSPAPAA
jgi:hypothetical protein